MADLENLIPYKVYETKFPGKEYTTTEKAIYLGKAPLERKRFQKIGSYSKDLADSGYRHLIAIKYPLVNTIDIYSFFNYSFDTENGNLIPSGLEVIQFDESKKKYLLDLCSKKGL
jgi:hypothetical protein